MATIPRGVTSKLTFTAVDGNGAITLRPMSSDGTLGKATTVRLGAGITKTVDPSSLGGHPAAVLMKPQDGSASVVGGTVVTAPVSGGTGISFLKIPAAPPGGSSMSVRIPR